VPLSITAVDGIRRWTCLSRHRRRVFSVPLTARSASQPEGPVQSGAFFLLLLLGKQKKKDKKSLLIYLFISLLAQRNEPKKRQPITWFDYVELPCAARQERATSESR